ncbi:GNAT family N-acetyltransferase [Carbonactinospora thermoautotrophica]|uniref:GNAT family N-acetyltransferase n=1 Tax=Carbonactinospora thermoautotrophica TaxID=1469144 RepID=UPI00226E361C|nr:GNAT family N-acetyltransferase [Carbonactinospora thermoautotrophica]MCX9190909.1 GNAT family N-acetyltransferase [Carbonactinospora thermoautotrophica]
MIRYEVIEGRREVVAVLREIVPVYAEVYAEPPYHAGAEDVERFRAWYLSRAARYGLRIVRAHDGGELIGVALGHVLPLDTRVHLLSGFGTTGRTLALNELFVRKPWRRQGVGRRLHDEFLDVPGVERATLTARPEAEPAQAAYRAWGWRKVGRTQPLADGPVYDLMVKDLSSGRVAARGSSWGRLGQGRYASAEDRGKHADLPGYGSYPD